MRSRQPEVVPRVFALCSTLLGRGCFLFAASNGMGLFTAVRDPGVRGKLAEACQPGSSNPSSASHIRKAAKPPTAIGILLSCAKKNGVGRQEEIAQRKPLRMVSSGLLRKQKGCGPFEIPGVPDLHCLSNGAIFYVFWKHSLSGMQVPTGL